MLSVDSRIYSEVSWFCGTARGEMLRVDESSVAGADAFCVPTTTTLHQSQALKPDCVAAKNTSSESSDNAVGIDKFCSANEQGSGKDSETRREGCGTMNGLAQLSKEKVLLKDSALSVFPSNLTQRIRTEGMYGELNILPLFRRLDGSRKLLPWGMKESPGYRTKMEDSTAVLEEFVTVTTLSSVTETSIPASLTKSLRYVTDLRSNDNLGQDSLFLSTSPFHFVGVFDGHGGTDVSTKLAEQLPEYIAQALRSKGRMNTESSGHTVPDVSRESILGRASGQQLGSSSCNCSRPSYTRSASPVKEAVWTDSREFRELSETENMDVDTPNISTLGNAMELHGSGNLELSDHAHPVLSLKEVEECLISAFTKFNNDLPNMEEKTVGSTAIVSLISDCHLVIANVGDSRAVLRRNGVAFRLSRDHKPDQEDEEDRIRKCGGRVWDFNGRRVMGLLAMTRAFGDDCLRPFGICATPEVTILPRCEYDEFLILACDGLWDVLADDEACHLVQRCFKRAEERDASSASACRVAASVLFRAAFTKGSNDNISVVVVDLRPQSSSDHSMHE